MSLLISPMSIRCRVVGGDGGGLFAKKNPLHLVWPNESEIKQFVNIQPHLLNTVLIVSKQQYYTESL